jgi:biotin synthase
MDRIVASGEPFRTSGCAGYDGEVACNRPFANSRPGPHLRNYPFAPTAEDIDRIRLQVGGRVVRLNERKKIVGEMNG